MPKRNYSTYCQGIIIIKIDRGKRIVAELGFRAGGAAGFGFRRMLLSADGIHHRLLKLGEIASVENGKVILVHGPAKEVAQVREIYRLAICEKKGAMAIARDLNWRRVKHLGRPLWNYQHVLEILTNPKYKGSAVYGRTSCMLGSEVVDNAPDRWIVKAEAFKPIIEPETFAAAQRAVYNRTFYQSDEQLLDRLRSLLSREGSLSMRGVDASREVPASRTYITRFGSMTRAYDLIGYVYPENPLGSPKIRKIMWRTRQRRERLRRQLLRSICKLFPGEVTVTRKGSIGRPMLCFRDGLRVSAVICPSRRHRWGSCDGMCHLSWPIRVA